MTPRPSSARPFLTCAAILAALLAADAASHVLLAKSPFGAPADEPQVGGIVGWLLAKQSEFYRQMSGTIRAAKEDGSAVWWLLVISFAYGIFHAAGPGHGKAVIASYLVANQETAKRGIVLSFVSGLMQALVAVAIVGVGAVLLNATAASMCSAEKVVEIASYGLIALLGARLVWVKGAAFLRIWQPAAPALALAGAPAGAVAHAGHDHGHAHDHQHRGPQHDHHGHDHHGHDHHGHDHHGHDHHGHDHHHGHGHAHTPAAAAHGHAHHDHVHNDHAHHDHVHGDDCGCGHSHGPAPSELAGPGGWQRGFQAIFAAGIRPCSGAILVLVFALAQGMFWAGVAATIVMGMGTAITVATIAVIAVAAKDLARRLSAGRDGGGALIMRGLEFGAAGLVLLFGVGLLFGYMAAERTTCF
ncbi:Putative High affinity nickel transporter [Bradyrhizobium sp. ORS 285]|uniref:nickel/cobalt transporter n=1 Tax=Bradyrhizobium sp. ORS 285 TaxID=115808 RepID=UPI0002405C53|nr:nickel/cobalt transporter [Bradyrhizobium sp. ORS 285]CCD87731.1 putative High affinity nickel transporter [Bradyrhizobium sp. ORS 285]SMX60947.1 Putative High affinity nickel transporter [Bradyrhizobium sp. ORS 285]